jgi:N-acetylglucosaminyl-diphospho-decaprenol L-rhamnosyltransferase
MTALQPDLSIIIVSWNVRDLLAACLHSIEANAGSLSKEIIVVDSASSDGTPNMIRAQFPAVRLLYQAENVGFTRGNNIGLAAATGRYIFLLNPDTEIVGDALPVMIDYLDTHPDVAILGPHTLNSDGTTQSSKRRFPTMLTGIFESTHLQRFAPRGLLDRFHARDIPDTAIAPVDWVQGSAILMRRAVYEKIGGLDEGFVMYSEEVDWCKRAHDAGFRLVYHGGATIVHHGGKSTEQASARTHVYFQKSKIRYFRKHHGIVVASILRVVVLWSYAQQLIEEWLKGVIGHRRPLRRERVTLYRQVLRGLLT